MFPLIDRDEDGLLSWEELYGFNINKVLPLYPDVFHPSAVSEQENTKETGGGDTDSKLCSSEETEFNRGVCKNQMKEKTAEEKKLDESGKSEHRLFDHEELWCFGWFVSVCAQAGLYTWKVENLAGNKFLPESEWF